MRTIPLVLLASVLALLGAGAPAYAKDSRLSTIAVNGQVTTPTTYTRDQLAALPQTSAIVSRGGRPVTVSGVLLETLVTIANPDYPPTLVNKKNQVLRVTATVKGAGHDDHTFAVGELDPNFGNHPALLVLTENGRPIDGTPDLVVPGDRFQVRSIARVSEVTVGIATAPATTTSPTAGSPLVIFDGNRRVSLSSAFLNRLPKESRTVSFQGPGGVQSHTEVGPSLLLVLAVAGILPTLDTWVAAVGSDNYVATVTPGEELFGGRHLQISLVEDGVTLAQPRLITDGDLKGGRYVSGMVNIYTGRGPAR